MGRIRVVIPRGQSHVHTVAHHVGRLQETGARIILLCADRPFDHYRASFGTAGADMDRIHALDCVAALQSGAPHERRPNVHFLASPTMLEMMAMRIEQIAQRLGPGSHLVVDSLSTLALYNGVEPVQEFTHFLANRLRMRQVPGDFVVHDNPAGADLRDRILGIVDEQAPIHGPGPAGEP